MSDSESRKMKQMVEWHNAFEHKRGASATAHTQTHTHQNHHKYINLSNAVFNLRATWSLYLCTALRNTWINEQYENLHAKKINKLIMNRAILQAFKLLSAAFSKYKWSWVEKAKVFFLLLRIILFYLMHKIVLGHSYQCSSPKDLHQIYHFL